MLAYLFDACCFYTKQHAEKNWPKTLSEKKNWSKKFGLANVRMLTGLWPKKIGRKKNWRKKIHIKKFGV